MLPSSRAKRTPREGAGQLPALLLDMGLLPAGHQEARVGEQGLRLTQQPTMHRFVLLLVLAGVMLCCLWVLLSMPLSAPHLSSALGGANVEHVDRGANAPAPLPNGSYPLMPAEEAQQTDSLPVNAYLLTMLMLACFCGWSVLEGVMNSIRNGLGMRET